MVFECDKSAQERYEYRRIEKLRMANQRCMPLGGGRTNIDSSIFAMCLNLDPEFTLFNFFDQLEPPYV